MPEPLSDRALVALVAERVMGYRLVTGGVGTSVRVTLRDGGMGVHRPFAFDPFTYDLDFCNLLDRCDARWGVLICTVYGDPREWKASVGDHRNAAVRDPSRRRALVLAAAAAVRAEGEKT